MRLWNDPSHTPATQPTLVLNEDLHRPNKKISISKMFASKTNNGTTTNRSNDSYNDDQSSIVNYYELNENLKSKL